MTLADRVRRAIEMPGLRRAERNQRLAMAGIILAVVLYFVIIPLVRGWIATSRKGPIVRAISAAEARAAVKQRR